MDANPTEKDDPLLGLAECERIENLDSPRKDEKNAGTSDKPKLTQETMEAFEDLVAALLYVEEKMLAD